LRKFHPGNWHANFANRSKNDQRTILNPLIASDPLGKNIAESHEIRLVPVFDCSRAGKPPLLAGNGV
jgi:hypothetical protein